MRPVPGEEPPIARPPSPAELRGAARVADAVAGELERLVAERAGARELGMSLLRGALALGAQVAAAGLRAFVAAGGIDAVGDWGGRWLAERARR